MAETPSQRNALVRANLAIQEGNPPTPQDLKTLEELETPLSDRILDRSDELKQQRLSQPTSLRSSVQSSQTTKARTTKKSPTSEDQGPLEGGKSEVTPPEKKKALYGREKDYYNFFDARFGPFIVLILYFCLADLDKAVFYAPSPDECHELAPHLARMGPKVEDWFRAPKWLHDAIVTSDDTFTVGMVLVGYLDRVGLLEKLLPWFQGTARKVKNLNEFKPETSTGQVQSNGDVPGPDRTRNFVPLDQLNVTGIGYQYESNPGT